MVQRCVADYGHGPGARSANFFHSPATALRVTLLTVGLAFCLVGPRVLAHDPRLDPPDPISLPEAWNTFRQCSQNVETLIENNQLDEVPYQVGNCSRGIHYLADHIADLPDAAVVKPKLGAIYGLGASVIFAVRDRDHPREKAQAAFVYFKAAIDEVASHYKPQDTLAEIYICPMHPLDRHLNPMDRCSVCDMALVRRRLAASSVYEKPGEPSMKLTATCDQPLQVGREAKVTITIHRNDGRPVTFDDLLVVHTRRIHMLIVDTSLGDYHHEHPAPTKTPGEYEFSFTPRRPGPYRLWADVVPGWSSLQEYLIADLKAEKPGEPLADRESTRKVTVEGLTYDLAFYPSQKPLRVGDSVIGRITVTGADGKPFLGLEPIMGAFAHLVGFNEDYRTVVHIHPMGGDVTSPEQRGGPTFQFKFYPPAAGYTRLYCQVNIGGQSKFAGFGVNVLPTLSGEKKLVPVGGDQ
jgi:hypothetical protein